MDQPEGGIADAFSPCARERPAASRPPTMER